MTQPRWGRVGVAVVELLELYVVLAAGTQRRATAAAATATAHTNAEELQAATTCHDVTHLVLTGRHEQGI